MNKFVRLAALVAASIVSVLCVFFLGAQAPAQESIQLQVTPPLAQVVPATEPVQISLDFLNANQQPLPPAKVQVTLFTPPKTPLFTSDFPIVQGQLIAGFIQI